MRRFLLPLLLSSVLIAGCETSLYQVRQASLVPAPTIPPPSAMDSRGDISISDTTVFYLAEPRVAPDENAGLWVARHQIEVYGSIWFIKNVGMRIGGLLGLAEGALRTAPTTLRRPNDPTGALGIGFLWRAELGKDLPTLDGSFDLQVGIIPTRMSITECRESGSGCQAPYNKNDTAAVGRLVFTFRLGTPNYDWGRVWLSLAGLNHPTNLEHFELASRTEPDAEVSFGEFNFVIGIGAELRMSDYAVIIPRVLWPVTEAPVQYAPIFGVGFRFDFGREDFREPEPVERHPIWQPTEKPEPLPEPEPEPAPEPETAPETEAIDPATVVRLTIQSDADVAFAMEVFEHWMGSYVVIELRGQPSVNGVLRGYRPGAVVLELPDGSIRVCQMADIEAAVVLGPPG